MTPPVDTHGLRKLLEKATPGPWTVGPKTSGNAIEILDWRGLECAQLYSDGPVTKRMRANAKLIVALVNAAPALLDEVDTFGAGQRVPDLVEGEGITTPAVRAEAGQERV